MKLVDDLERLGIGQTPGSGIFCLDFAVHFPYTGQEKLELTASLSEEPLTGCGLLDIGSSCVQNHRYPNKDYVTMTQKFGRKSCRCGAILQLSHAKLATFRYLNLGYSHPDNVKGNIMMSVPVAISTSDDLPCTALTARILLNDIQSPGLTMKTYQAFERGWRAFIYGTDTESGDNFTKLTAENIVDKPQTAIVYRETVRPFACEPKDVLII